MSYVIIAILAGLAAIERKGFLQAMLARPVALSTLTGLALGDVQGGVLVGAPLELFWLGAVNLGAALPVHEALGAAAVTGGAVLAGRALGGVTPEVAVLSLLLAAPLAVLGRRAERLTEIANERLAARAEEALASGDASGATRVNLLGLLAPFLISALLAPLGAAVAAVAVPRLVLGPLAALPLAAGWFAFAGLACASGAKAMRAPQARVVYYAALVAGAAAVVTVMWRTGARA
ncbi:MAG TPA: PTS sugar transporter subunit IIC [Anaeromyxobacteraceae bacterium]|nr:PTS sugar transporter subunit IIC [Anaeromyxobacteraceae bacterium]